MLSTISLTFEWEIITSATWRPITNVTATPASFQFTRNNVPWRKKSPTGGFQSCLIAHVIKFFFMSAVLNPIAEDYLVLKLCCLHYKQFLSDSNFTALHSWLSSIALRIFGNFWHLVFRIHEWHCGAILQSMQWTCFSCLFVSSCAFCFFPDTWEFQVMLKRIKYLNSEHTIML